MCCFKPPSVWYFVTAALENQDGRHRVYLQGDEDILELDRGSRLHNIVNIHCLQLNDGLTYDFLTLQWCKSHAHSIETVL